jgi:phosphoribosyl 1,2-cyclic phosphodiesterase
VPDAIIHGCNTPCIEVHDERSGGILVFDAGSGIVGVDPAMISKAPAAVSLILTHYHWDHLLGLPFFSTLYQPGWDLTIHTPTLESHDPSWLDTMFKSPFFPVPYQHLPNKPRVQMVQPGVLSIPDFDVTALDLNHPGGALAYRVKGTHGDFVYATDHEFGDPKYDEPLADFASGAMMVLDRTTPTSCRSIAAGHSDWRQSAEFAAANDSRPVAVPPRPGRSDQALAGIRVEAQKIFAATDRPAKKPPGKSSRAPLLACGFSRRPDPGQRPHARIPRHFAQ